MSRAKERIARRRKTHVNKYHSDPIYISTESPHVPYSLFDELELSPVDISIMSDNYMRDYEKVEREFKEKTKLNGLDYKFLFLATALQIIRQHIFTNNTFRIDSNVGDDYKTNIKKKVLNVTPDDMQQYVNMIFGKAPYDKIIPGLSGTNHRYMTLGHDPLGGWIFGTLNFATNTLTLKDLSLSTYDVSSIPYETSFSQVLHDGLNKFYEEPVQLPVCILAQAVHLGSDAFTTFGLPIPIINNIPNKNAAIEKFLQRNCIDLYSVTRGAIISEFINRCIFAIHSLLASPNEDNRLHEIRTRKIIIYSGVLSSASNIIEVGLTKNFRKLDVGGILVASWHFFKDRKYIQQIEREFINESLDNQIEAQIQELDAEIAFYEKRLGITI